MWEAIGPIVGGLIGAGGSMMSGAMAQASLEEAQKKALALIQESVEDYRNIGLPPEQALAISLERYKQAGILDPELENVINQNPTEMLGIQTDPRLRDAEMSALNELRGVGESGGLRLADLANYEKVMADVAQRERGAREAIMLDEAQRGVSTGGNSLAEQLLNNQANSQARHQAGLDLFGRAQDVALESILKSGELGGRIQAKDFSQQAEKARAQDVINEMNTQASRGVQQRNVSARNAAQEQNLNNVQNIWNANTGLSNEQEIYNKKLPQQMFENAMTRQNAIANARAGQASNTISSGNTLAQNWGGIGAAINKAGTGIGNYFASEYDDDRKLRTDRPRENLPRQNPPREW